MAVELTRCLLECGALLRMVEPSKSMIGFDFDLCYSDVYCFQDSAWLNYKTMRDAGVFLGQYKNKSIMMIPLPKDSNHTDPKTKQTVDLSTSTVKAIVRPVAAREFVLLPISIGGVQWEGLVIDKASRAHTYQEEQEASTILG
ncbi:Cysteine protease family C48 [Phytophthora palmivora]|uniref:Cysteine protease family C48 n=1 Tax=Phytophthora palmivora TaxID=4796 RepID=A0A2P4YS00_9STRA|nr:Cysteine protease family C48 [Phytophthora palmivora]